MKTAAIIMHNKPHPYRAGTCIKGAIMRLLVFIAAIILLMLAFRNLLPRPRNKTRDDQTPEKMVSCAKCRLYLPQSEALSEDEHFFCNPEHHRAWLKDQRAKKN